MVLCPEWKSQRVCAYDTASSTVWGTPNSAAAAAKAAVSTTLQSAAETLIPVHGGIGFTWEHDLHLFIRRAYGAAALLGPTDWHHDRLADLLL